MSRIAIDALRPTQFTLGFDEVAKRKAKFLAADAAAREATILDKAVPHVVGPDAVPYIVDHHHFVRLAWEAGLAEVELGECLADLRTLSQGDFWKVLERDGRCWPIDAEGNRRPLAKMPSHVSQLTANPWRDLARKVRGEAFENLDTPYQEFKWGNYFRSFMTRRLLEVDFDRACKLAVRLAALDEAQDLPGWRS